MKELEQKQIRVIKGILNSPINRAVCDVCGNYQSHKQVHCTSCGKPFGKKLKTLLEGLKVAHRRQLQDRRVALRPEYHAAVWQRTLTDAGISKKAFTEYVTKLLEAGDKHA